MPGEGEIVVDVARCGINFADTHATRNDYLAEQQLPLIPGGEIAGRTADGRRVAAILATGGYASKVVVPEAWAIPVADEVSDDVAAGAPAPGPDRARARPPLRAARGRRDRRRRGRRGRDRNASPSSSPSVPARG